FQDGAGTHATWLIQGNDGNLYGTAAGDSSGGFFNHPPQMHNAGIFFSLTTTGTLTVLYSFSGGSDGSFPKSIVQASDGNFYGSALNGPESPPNVFNGFGKLFRISATGIESILYGFTGGIDGGYPSKLIQGGDGNFYGITGYPNINNLFKVTEAGVRNTI